MSKHSSLLIAALALAGFGSVAKATAQDLGGSGEIDRPWRFHVGAFFPTDKSVRDLAGNTHFALGGSYDLKQTNMVTNTLFQGLYADGTFGNSGGGHASTYGGGYQVRLRFGNPAKGINEVGYLYVGGGLGLYLIDDNFVSASTVFRLGGKLFAGFETTKGYFFEAAYSLVGSVDGYQPSGFTASIGLRF